MYGGDIVARKRDYSIINAYNDEKYDRFNMNLPKGMKALIQAAADAAGTSMSDYMLTATLTRMKKEGRGQLVASTAPEGEETV